MGVSLSLVPQVLWFNDQMRIEMAKGNVFKGFSEGPVHFQPTYKFDKNSNTYDSSKKQRIPSWTDRIVYRSNVHPSPPQPTNQHLPRSRNRRLATCPHLLCTLRLRPTPPPSLHTTLAVGRKDETHSL